MKKCFSNLQAITGSLSVEFTLNELTEASDLVRHLISAAQIPATSEEIQILSLQMLKMRRQLHDLYLDPYDDPTINPLR